MKKERTGLRFKVSGFRGFAPLRRSWPARVSRFKIQVSSAQAARRKDSDFLDFSLLTAKDTQDVKQRSLKPLTLNLKPFLLLETLLVFLCCLLNGQAAEPSASPRIVNIYNFIRNSDFRLEHSEERMLDCTRRQIALLKSVDLPATWALQYDALINPSYPKLLKAELGTNDEIAAWWEIPRQLAEKAGLKWRGRHDWDPEAHVGFSPGYTPEERRKLVDVYMADFKAAFGYYPKTVGSWFIDEVTLAYMAEKYGVIASCNCKDQIGTDFYTLWGGYWNQAYYPSRVNAYMPAQTRQGQIDVPVFRMLGSDPIYEHGRTPGLISMEPIYRPGGGSPKWVDWYLQNLTAQPALAFAYVQAGQENSFTWEPMQKGLTDQAQKLAGLAKAGTIRVETLAQSGQWFKDHFPVTPPTSVVALDDWKNEGRKTVWYDSRFYRLNVLWESNVFFIRDLHGFDERIVSPTHETPLRETSLTYETLPLVDWANGSDSGKKRAGLWPVRLAADGSSAPLSPDGAPTVRALNATDLQVDQPLQGGGAFSLICRESSVEMTALTADGQPLPWACDLMGNGNALIKKVDGASVTFRHGGVEYPLKLGAGTGLQGADGQLRLKPGGDGRLVLKLAW